EQAAVQERNFPQGPDRATALCRRAIQRTEAERVQERTMKVAPAEQGAVEQVWHVARVAVQPAFRLDEIKEEHASQCGQRQSVAVETGTRRAKLLGQVHQRAAERAEETWCDAFARQHLADAQRQGERRFADSWNEPFERC